MSTDYVPDYIPTPGTALEGKVAIVTGGASASAKRSAGSSPPTAARSCW